MENINKKITVYMILDVYDRHEWVDIYSKIYKKAPKYWHKVYIDACKDFESMGPDDCHQFGVFALNITNKELNKLRTLKKNHFDQKTSDFLCALYEQDKIKLVLDGE